METINTVYRIGKNEAMPYSTGSYMQYLVITCIGKEYEKRLRICICITESLSCSPVPKTVL